MQYNFGKQTTTNEDYLLTAREGMVTVVNCHTGFTKNFLLYTKEQTVEEVIRRVMKETLRNEGIRNWQKPEEVDCSVGITDEAARLMAQHANANRHQYLPNEKFKGNATALPVA